MTYLAHVVGGNAGGTVPITFRDGGDRWNYAREMINPIAAVTNNACQVQYEE